MLNFLAFVIVIEAILIYWFFVTRERAESNLAKYYSMSQFMDFKSQKNLEVSIKSRFKNLSSKNLLAVVAIKIEHYDLIRTAFNENLAKELVDEVEKLLSTDLSDRDDIYRISDSMFVVVSDSSQTYSDMKRYVNNLKEILSKPVSFGRHTQIVTSKFGYSWADSKEKHVDDLVSRAIAAQADSSDKSRIINPYDDSVRLRALEHLELEKDLRRALNSGELEVHYQGIFDVNTGEVFRYESFIRWFHPSKGLISPHKFLGIASKNDLISLIGKFVFDSVSKQALAWTNESGSQVRISVNISDQQLLGENFTENLRDSLYLIGLDPSQLELEFNENIFTINFDYVLEMMNVLSDIGVSIAIDNFGATKASLGLITDLPMVSTLKLDRKFVQGITESKTQKQLVESINLFAREYGVDVVAEGIESLDTALVLKDIGVDYLQGFLLQRPKPSQDIIFNKTDVDLSEVFN